VVIMGVVDTMSPRARSSRAMAWSLGAGGALALAGIVLIWVGARV